MNCLPNLRMMASLCLLILIPICSVMGQTAGTSPDNSNCYGIDSTNPRLLRELLHYRPSHGVLISAHRGGAQPGFPENCIETFEHSLATGCVMLEVDPRLTKDGQIVLHHDATLDRTTTGSGPLAEKTLEELKHLRLIDLEGRPTNFQMPTLDESIQWARARTILVLDQKDVPLSRRIEVITENHAEGFVMLIISSVSDALTVHRSNPDIVMEIMVPNLQRVKAIDESGIPWDRLIAFVGHQPPNDSALIEAIHRRGAMCMAGTSRNLDKELAKRGVTDNELMGRYHDLLDFGIDVVETDLPIQLHRLLETDQ